MGRLTGKVALETAGATGLGRPDSERFVAEGADGFVSDIDDAAAGRLADALGEHAFALRHDVASEDDWRRVYAEIDARFGRLDILVNNAGIVVVADPEETSLDQYERVMSVMATSVFLGCKLGLPLLARSRGASIINMSSIASHFGYPPFFAYSAAKGAVRSMSKAIAIHCQDKGYPIRCNTVHPSSIETPMVQSAEGRPGVENAIPAGILPAGAVGAPRDVANLLLFLASDEARFLTGGEYLVDNAMSIRP